jgi:hypothetical protein
VTAAVKLDDSTVTTRKVQNLARQVAAFVKPERWVPNEERVYMPLERNRLALMRWAVERADLEECGERLLGLKAEGYANVNLLRKSPLVLVRGSALGTVLEALGLQRERAWEEFAEETGRGCGSCVFGEIEPVVGVMTHCPKWSSDPGGV